MENDAVQVLQGAASGEGEGDLEKGGVLWVFGGDHRQRRLDGHVRARLRDAEANEGHQYGRISMQGSQGTALHIKENLVRAPGMRGRVGAGDHALLPTVN